MPLVVPIVLLLSLGVGTLVAVGLASSERDVPVHEPDYVPAPVGRTGWKRVDTIMSELQRASSSSGVPLGVLVGWVCKESGGRLDEVTKYNERGLFQLMVGESKRVGLDHERLSTDLNYSINGGLAIIAAYMGDVDRLGVAQRGTEFYWKLVKLVHSMGDGAVKKIVVMAKDAGETRTWRRFESYALDHESEIMSATKHSPEKWFKFVDAVADVGRPFGFGGQETIVGGEVFADIVDPLDCLPVM